MNLLAIISTSFLAQLLVLCLVFGLLFYVLSKIPIAEPWKTAARVIAFIIAIVILLRMIGMV